MPNADRPRSEQEKWHERHPGHRPGARRPGARVRKPGEPLLPPPTNHDPAATNALITGAGRWAAISRFRHAGDLPGPAGGPLSSRGVEAVSAPIFLIMRRMRTPLIVLIIIFAITTFGLAVAPGETPEGEPHRMGMFNAFYVMSYTASTIGFGEIPYPFTAEQRLWMTLSIYLTVVGWAYTIGTLLSLLQDRAFRTALDMRRFTSRVERMREPFLLIAGYGHTGQRLGQAWDHLGRNFVAIDVEATKIESLDVDQYFADPPGLTADASNPFNLKLAGLKNPHCEAVLALTDDDEVNLAITMTAALLRPDLPVIARTISAPVEDRMRAWGAPTVINPFDRFGDHLRMALRAPISFRLYSWLEAGPGSEQPPPGSPPAKGLWVVCGYGRFGQEVVGDLLAEGLDVVVVDPDPPTDEFLAAELDIPVERLPRVIHGDGSEPEVMDECHIETAVGFVAGTDDDTTNLSLIAAARRRNPDLYVAGRQNLPTNQSLFTAMHLDMLLVPADLVAREAYARLSTPLLWRFLEEMPHRGEDEAIELIQRIKNRCGQFMKDVWNVELTAWEAPALAGYLDPEAVPARVRQRRHAAQEGRRVPLTIGDLLRDPDDREDRLAVVPLMLLRDGKATIGPPDDTELRLDDELLVAGTRMARRELQTTLLSESTAQYVVTGTRMPESWVWRQLAGRRLPRAGVDGPAADGSEGGGSEGDGSEDDGPETDGSDGESPAGENPGRGKPGK
ncbi:potassium channel family protein [Kineosporia rhizophila]|uniref:potassium channel family protein n=1 Tax=Kineosporia rhizophila TaxID=84633 RepID=UPI001E41C70A|nr:NAD-binding protein [Kineosporia rhizophila]MCE0535581.1 potassium channel family protein [Kineosporia rhizophila]